MARARNARFFLGLVIFSLVAVSIAYLVESPRAKRTKPPAKQVKIDQAEVTIDGFRFANTENEVLSWQLNAAKAEMKKDTGMAKLHDLEAVFNGKDGMVVKLKADEGAFDTGTKAIRLSRADKDITITSNNGCTIAVRELNWDNNKRELSTNDKVTIDSKNLRIEGRGLVARSDLQEVRINNGVKTTFTPSK